MNCAVLIPVKNLSQAKTRLAPFLTPHERRTLAMTMLRGTMARIAELPGSLRKTMITSYGPAIELAREFGFDLIEERSQISESHSVDAASAALEAEGVDGVLRVPLDLPLLKTADLASILDHGSQGQKAVIVPSLHGTGTNGLFRSPPTLFPSYFGEGSLAKHVAAAEKLTERFMVLEMQSMALDIDDKDDLAALLARDEESDSGRYLKEIDIPARIARAAGP